MKRNASTAAAMMTSPGLTCASPQANETTWAMKVSPVTRTPVSWPSCPAIMMNATPVR